MYRLMPVVVSSTWDQLLKKGVRQKRMTPDDSTQEWRDKFAVESTRESRKGFYILA